MRVDQPYIAKFNDLSSQDVSSLEAALAKHPYSSTLAVLLSRAYEQRGNIGYEETLRRAALLTQNRKKLHAFIFSAPGLQEPVEAPEANAKAEDIEAVQDTTTKPSEGVSSDELDLVSRLENIEPAESDLHRTSDKEDTPASSEPEKVEKDPLDDLFLAEALGAGAAVDLIDRLDDPSDKDDRSEASQDDGIDLPTPLHLKADDTELVDRISASMGEDKSEGVTEGQEETTEKTETEQPTRPSAPPRSEATPSKQRFSAWLTTMEQTEPVAPEEDTPQSSFGRTPSEASPSSDEAEQGLSSFKEVASIIDNFIEKEDAIVPKRAEFFSPTKAAKSSIEDREEIVTETLAGIYAAQGNYGKAISTYEKLSLLHPEKSSYFAGLIEKLKSDKKDKS